MRAKDLEGGSATSPVECELSGLQTTESVHPFQIVCGLNGLEVLDLMIRYP